MGRKNASAAPKEPLSLADGNKRKSSRTRPTQSQKEKENIAQQQDGFTIPDDESVEEMVNGMDTTEDTENGGHPNNSGSMWKPRFPSNNSTTSLYE